MINMMTYPPVHQKGAALIVSLLILLVMTVLGVARWAHPYCRNAWPITTDQQQVAFQAAEAALRAAEDLSGHHHHQRHGIEIPI